ncbi:hypothetical protein E2C01_034014 [Portunus trituberculatus]|uniref:Uncharacterized protein n=1 Tax=Portunus trituberculatus TaxID=210409 RepID=A0A5B7F4H9_PORTR|nr:hypothetical protein [Portunus trituberculatus]
MSEGERHQRQDDTARRAVHGPGEVWRPKGLRCTGLNPGHVPKEQQNKYGNGNIETPRSVTRPLGEQMLETRHAGPGRCAGDMAGEQVPRTRRERARRRSKRETRKEMTEYIGTARGASNLSPGGGIE